MPANQLPSQHYFSAILITSLITSVAFLTLLFLYICLIYYDRSFLVVRSILGFLACSCLTVFSRLYCQTLGGLMIGYYGDTKGRRPALFISLLGITIFTLFIGLLPQYSQIGFIAPIIFIVARVIQSLAIGGIMPSVWVYVTEHLPTRHIGVGCGAILSGCVLSLIF